METEARTQFKHQWDALDPNRCRKCGGSFADIEFPNCQVLKIVIPFLPPSSNNCYVTNWRKKIRFPTKEANAFKKKFSSEVVPGYLADLGLLDLNAIYGVHYD